ncbi:hypothetical protein CXB51_004784 [Gossypium anomalum]|uniref:F-box domain-containing protein n=1 Tax=Gossypium anomalum TaxID=47600 RepID=A0A8J6A166_9ROSI|nr:hypothetical protein CXB51_004784 [Gossypium anomalum]
MKTEVSEMEERKGKGEVMSGTLDLSALPLDCITLIISFTSPRDACRLSLVSTALNSATESDAALIPSSLSFSSKKQLYLSLCENPLLIEAGRKIHQKERERKKRATKRIGIDETEFLAGQSEWEEMLHAVTQGPHHYMECGHPMVLEMGALNPMPGLTRLPLFFEIQANKVYGFDYYPVKLSVGVVGTEGSKRSAYLQREKGRRRRPLNDTGGLEVEMGEFFNEGCVDDGELEMSALEIEYLNQKGGLILQGIEIRAITRN